MLYSFENKVPKLLGNNYFIAESASVIGAVIIHNNVIILPNAVVRADNEIIEIGDNTNIQDGAIAHNAMVHGRAVGDNSVIAIGAVVLSNAVIGNNCMIAANALVLENQIIPDGSLVMGTGKIKAQLSEKQIAEMACFAQHYVEKIARFKKGLRPFDSEIKKSSG